MLQARSQNIGWFIATLKIFLSGMRNGRTGCAKFCDSDIKAIVPKTPWKPFDICRTKSSQEL